MMQGGKEAPIDEKPAGLQNFMIRVSPDILKEIDELVKKKRYATRSDFVKVAIITYLSDIRGSDRRIQETAEIILSGKVDDAIKTRMKEIIRELV
jgi:Arc/MetJ-type ribon-helix-helix transcriptional regulator